MRILFCRKSQLLNGPFLWGDVDTTPANCSTTGELEELLKGSRLPDNTCVYADKGYTSKANSTLLKEQGYKDGIMHRAYRNKPLANWQRYRNHFISKRRDIEERVFGTVKVQGELLLSSLAGL